MFATYIKFSSALEINMLCLMRKKLKQDTFRHLVLFAVRSSTYQAFASFINSPWLLDLPVVYLFVTIYRLLLQIPSCCHMLSPAILQEWTGAASRGNWIMAEMKKNVTISFLLKHNLFFLAGNMELKRIAP